MPQDLFLVGPNQAYKQVQEAIDVLIAQQGINTFTSEKKILIVENGVYEKFRIPTDSLRPDSASRLVIGSAAGILAIISGNLTQDRENGCLVGSNVPYVTIQKLYFQNFVKGIVFSVNSHEPIVKQCVIVNSENAGVWIYQSDDAQVVNNVILNAKYGVVSTLVKNIAVIYNTIYNEPLHTSADSACLFVELQRDRTHGVEDHGKATIFNNVLFSIAGSCLLINERDLTNIQSDFNDMFTQSGRIARVRIEIPEDDTAFSDATFNDIATLEAWRDLTQWDTVSISEHPIFIQQDESFGGSFVDLGLLPVSPCINSAKLLCGDPTNDLDDYIDDSLLCTDILGKPRSSQPTIGANEITVQDGFYGQSVFTSTPVEQQTDLVCGSQWSALDLAISQYANSVECWFPEVKSGYFFVRENPYYLYSQKRAETLRYCTRTSFTLAHPLERSSIEIWLSGRNITDADNWRIEGRSLQVKHLDTPVASLNDEILIHGDFKEWVDSIKEFRNRRVTQRFRLREGEQSYWLPSNPKDAAPIVITDDTIVPLDFTGLLPTEFITEWDSEHEETQIKLHPNTNLLLNPQFDYGVELVDEIGSLTISTGDFTTVSNTIRRQQDDPDKRHLLAPSLSTVANNRKDFRVTREFLSRTIATSTGMTHHGYELPEDYEVVTDGRIALRSVVQVDNKRSIRPLMGRQFAVFDVPTGDTGDHYLAQDVSVDRNDSYFFSTYVAAPDATGTAYVTVDVLDRDGGLLTSSGPHSYAVSSPEVEPGQTGHAWTRVGIAIGNTGDSTPSAPGPQLDLFWTGQVPLNTGADRVIVKLSSETGLPIAYDCLQFEQGDTPGLYNRIPRGADVTVEYEDSDKGFYRIKDLAVSPMRNPKVDGFLQIAPIAAGQFDTGAPQNTTTLTDWFWPEGRLNYLPWARTSGIHKWRRTSWPHSEYQGVVDPGVTWDENIAHAERISTIPGIPSSNQDSSGDLFTIFAEDVNGNPYAFNPVTVEVFDDQAEFPGWVARREFGIVTQLGQKISTNTNTKGTTAVLYYPPASEDVEYRGNKPVALNADLSDDLPEENRIYGFVDVNYKVSVENHGNITVHDQFLNKISTEDTSTFTGYMSPKTDSQGYSHYDMRDFAVAGTLRVFDDMTGSFDRELELSADPTLDFGWFHYDESSSRITVKGTSSSNLKVTYKRRLAWIVPEYPRRTYIDSQILDQVTGDIIINYDAEIRMKITVQPPERTAGLPSKFREISVIAQNKHAGLGQ